jgi:hypothetical protein
MKVCETFPVTGAWRAKNCKNAIFARKIQGIKTNREELTIKRNL